MTVALSFSTTVLETKHWTDILNFGRKGALYNTTFPFPHLVTISSEIWLDSYLSDFSGAIVDFAF